MTYVPVVPQWLEPLKTAPANNPQTQFAEKSDDPHDHYICAQASLAAYAEAENGDIKPVPPAEVYLGSNYYSQPAAAVPAA